MAELAGYGQSAMVGFHDRAADGEPHACSRGLLALRPRAIEPIEDQRLLSRVNPNTTVRHTGQDDAALLFGCYKDR